MDIDIKNKTIMAKIDSWNFEADYIYKDSIKIFLFGDSYCFGNKFVGYYIPESEEIKPLYYNSNIDYREKIPTKRQQEKIKRLCKRLFKTLQKEGAL